MVEFSWMPRCGKSYWRVYVRARRRSRLAMRLALHHRLQFGPATPQPKEAQPLMLALMAIAPSQGKLQRPCASLRLVSRRLRRSSGQRRLKMDSQRFAFRPYYRWIGMERRARPRCLLPAGLSEEAASSRPAMRRGGSRTLNIIRPNVPTCSQRKFKVIEAFARSAAGSCKRTILIRAKPYYCAKNFRRSGRNGRSCVGSR
jgi:hypothetical protein